MAPADLPGHDRSEDEPDQHVGTGERTRQRLTVRKDPVYVRRRQAVLAGLGALVLLLVVVFTMWSLGKDDGSAGASEPTSPVADVKAPDDAKGTAGAGEEAGQDGADDDSTQDDAAGDGAAQESPALWQKEPTPAERPSDETAMTQVDYLTEGTPKSVVSSGHGLAITNNMMYSHTSTIFDVEKREVIERLDDSLDLAEFGLEGHPGVSKGSPVEAVWTDDGRYAYVSQYSMYGQNFGLDGFDDCVKDSGVGASLVYRFDADEMAWDQVIKVGAVPKYLELTPDQSTLLVSNWCDDTVSLVDTATGTETDTLDVGRNPRGIVAYPDNSTALVTAMFNQQVWRLDLEKGTSEVALETPPGPRHLNLTADGKLAYLVVAKANLIYKLDAQTMEILDEVTPGLEPRSMTMSPDGKALYVVNYNEATVAKIRTSDMEVIDRAPVDAQPIGIDYDPVTNTVWVACYNGGIYVFDDQSTLLEDAD